MTDLVRLASDMADLQAGDSLPPVDKWNPERSGEIDIVIRRDGVWVHEGSTIARPKLVRLFSTVLKREGDDYFLVTPVEKFALTVEDVPFVATAMEVTGEGEEQAVTFRTNVGDKVTAGPDHPLQFRATDEAEDTLIPYIEVRAGLEARLARTVWYDFAQLLEGDPPFLRSRGVVFPYTEDAKPGRP